MWRKNVMVDAKECHRDHWYYFLVFHLFILAFGFNEKLHLPM